MKKPTVLLIFLFCLLSSSFAQTDSLQTAPAFLPLRIKSLDAKVVDKNVQLTWNVTGNEDAKNFEVERSEDGAHFYKIGGRLALPQRDTADYEFVDALPKRNVLFAYRIRLNGRDGTTAFSDSQAIKIEAEALQCKLKQNPVRQTIDLEITAPAAVQMVATVVTAYGQKLAPETTRLAAGINAVSLSSQNLQAGLHRLVLDAGNERKVLSFVKE